MEYFELTEVLTDNLLHALIYFDTIDTNTHVFVSKLVETVALTAGTDLFLLLNISFL